MAETREEKVQKAVDGLRAENSNLKLFEITVPGHEDEVFIARKCNWAEYKGLIGKVKDEATANEILVQRFLVHPKVSYETINLEWDPGLVVTLAQQIQKGLGFAGDGASLKNV